MNAGVIGQEGTTHVESDHRFYRGLRNPDVDRMAVAPDRSRSPEPQAQESLRIARTIRTLADLDQATSEARLLHGSGLRFTGLQPGHGSQTIMTFVKQK